MYLEEVTASYIPAGGRLHTAYWALGDDRSFEKYLHVNTETRNEAIQTKQTIPCMMYSSIVNLENPSKTPCKKTCWPEKPLKPS